MFCCLVLFVLFDLQGALLVNIILSSDGEICAPPIPGGR